MGNIHLGFEVTERRNFVISGDGKGRKGSHDIYFSIACPSLQFANTTELKLKIETNFLCRSDEIHYFPYYL